MFCTGCKRVTEVSRKAATACRSLFTFPCFNHFCHSLCLVDSSSLVLSEIRHEDQPGPLSSITMVLVKLPRGSLLELPRLEAARNSLLLSLRQEKNPQ
ncbi:hypothetical protein TNCV_2925371 [Trichonephila clavipes]|nr:hypothetical protein TNCV_2925371 [Trichonephila clavipes]